MFNVSTESVSTERSERKTAAPAGSWLTEHHILRPAVTPDDPSLTEPDLRDNIQHIYNIVWIHVRLRDPVH